MYSNNEKGVFHMTTTAKMWGNSLGVRIPQKVAQKFDVVNGSQIEIIETDEGIVLKPVDKRPTLDELLAQCTPDKRHEEFFSTPMGRELL